MTQEPDNLRLGIKLGPYIIGTAVRTDRFSRIYNAVDRTTDKPVLVEEYFPVDIAIRSQSNSQVELKDISAADLFQRNLKSFLKFGTMLSTISHPSINKIHGIFEVLNTGILVRNKEEGMRLKEYLSAPNAPIENWPSVLFQCIRAFHILHQKGFLHRNVLPRSIFIQGGVPVLTDIRCPFFGEGGNNTTIIHTNTYASPEELLDMAPYNTQSEIYTLGAIFYHIFSGKQPQRGDQRYYLDRTPPLKNMQELSSKFPCHVLSSIDKAISPQPSDRFSTMEEWLAALA